MNWIKKFIVKGIFLNVWVYIAIITVYLLIYSETKNQSRYVLMLQESTGNMYHASLTSPSYNTYFDRFNILDDDDVFNIKSYNVKYLHYIGNINKEIKVDNKIEFPTLTVLPNRKFVIFNSLPEIIIKSTSQADVFNADLTGLESKGLTDVKMIMGDSAENLEKILKERSDKFKAQNPVKTNKVK